LKLNIFAIHETIAVEILFNIPQKTANGKL